MVGAFGVGLGAVRRARGVASVAAVLVSASFALGDGRGVALLLLVVLGGRRTLARLGAVAAMLSTKASTITAGRVAVVETCAVRAGAVEKVGAVPPAAAAAGAVVRVVAIAAPVVRVVEGEVAKEAVVEPAALAPVVLFVTLAAPWSGSGGSGRRARRARRTFALI